ncbi:unnamed protein product [Peronospora belbahrii]|uniref:Dolichyl-diphosphooligosaccharide--protein glycosyltransferase subunit 2 n=1 Tax=Peronospora belbahrii TaxID=622444 RepID=A0AAU9KT38_9STRA|nr:unnamed protein product [Peronospora belbahrii]
MVTSERLDPSWSNETRSNSEIRPLLARSVGSSVSSTSSSRRVHVKRWHSLNIPQYPETIYNTLINYAPVSVVLFGGLTLLIGVFVLIHTQHLVATADLPHSSLATMSPIVQPEIPRIQADTSNCSELWIEQHIDHFSWLPAEAVEISDINTTPSGLPATYQQRYLLNTQFWDPSDKKAPVFFYTGNEGDVTLYANHTGLIWENAQAFKALIVFAEHRYYGKSLPFGDKYIDNLAYLSHDQALADYIELIYHLQKKYDAFNHPVIAFGGSYGGMLSAWFRMKYPAIIAGAIAASAPIYGFSGFPDFDGQKYWQVVTRDASPDAGSAKNCVANARKSWPQLFELAKTENGRTTLTSLFRLCQPLSRTEEGNDLAMSVLFAFDVLAMGNYPYPSSYLTEGAVNLPAWPVREACSHLAGDFPAPSFSQENVDTTLLEALRDAANVYYNATKDLKCYKIPTLWDYDGIWDYQYCTEMLPQETYFSTNGETDMFWLRDTTFEEIPTAYWILGEVLACCIPPKDAKVTIVDIAEGAHHLDLFFSHPKDPPSVIVARETEVKMIRAWIDEFVAYNASLVLLSSCVDAALDIEMKLVSKHLALATGPLELAVVVTPKQPKLKQLSLKTVIDTFGAAVLSGLTLRGDGSKFVTQLTDDTKLKAGMYKLKVLAVDEETNEEAMRTLHLKVTTSVEVVDANVNGKKLQLGDKLTGLSFNAATDDTLKMEVTLQQTHDKSPVKAHLAFLRFTHATEKTDTYFVLTAEEAQIHSTTLHFGALSKKFRYNSGDYHAELVLGASTFEKAIVWDMGIVELQLGAALPETPSPLYKKPLLHESDTTLTTLPEISHVMRKQDSRPPVTVSFAFACAVVAPLVFFLLFVMRLGMNTKRLFEGPVFIFGCVFLASLGGIFGLFGLYWVHLTMFRTLGYLSVLGSVTLWSGHLTLKRLAETRVKKTSKVE